MPAAWIEALAGGVLLGISASLLLWLKGRVCGISGMFGGALMPQDGERGWRVAFLLGLLAGGGLLMWWTPEAIATPTGVPMWLIAIAGVLVGVGTQLGNGCTSGHGICGLTRGSGRSLAATMMFMLTGALTASGVGLLLRGM